MKKIFTLLSFILVTCTLMAQTNGKQIITMHKEIKNIAKSKQISKAKYDISKISGQEKVPSKQTHFEWSNGWEFYYNSTIEYHIDGRIKSELLKDELGRDMSRVFYSYDLQNRLIEVNTELLNGSVWNPYGSTIITYNSQGDILMYEDRYWNNNSWLTIFGQRFDIEYDVNAGSKTTISSSFNGSRYDTIDKRIEYKINNIITVEETYYYDFTGSFIPVEQFEYIFDNSGIDTGLLKRVWTGSNWQEDILYCNYQWDNPGKEFLSYDNVFIKVGLDWRLYERENFSRDNYGSFHYLLEKYMNGLWQGDMRISSINDIYKARIEYVYDLYIGGAWIQLFKIEEDYVYDTEGNVLEYIYRESDSNGEMQNLYKDIFSDYIVLTGINKTKTAVLRLYPNPASSYIIISDQNLIGRKYKITNLAGNIISSDLLNESKKIDIDKLQNGLYIISIGSLQAKFKIEK